jgi:hypothetical protein
MDKNMMKCLLRVHKGGVNASKNLTEEIKTTLIEYASSILDKVLSVKLMFRRKNKVNWKNY